jgi:hypothetical protein
MVNKGNVACIPDLLPSSTKWWMRRIPPFASIEAIQQWAV